MLDIVVYVRFYFPHSNCGSDWALHTTLKYLQGKGHKITVVLGDEAKGCPYVHDGIQVQKAKPYGMDFIDCDLVFTQLDFTADCCNKVKRKPIVWFMHNTTSYGSVRRNKDRVFVVYNSEAGKEWLDYPNDSFVLPPPVDIDRYNVCEGMGNFEGAITLINLNENKGAELFYKLAEMNPDLQFLGVIGAYGIQILKQLPNVTIVPTQAYIQDMYAQTAILLMPSERESWGRTATEAAANGIPVISTDLPGLRENMGDAGIYIDRNDVQKWSDMVRKLKGKKEYAEQSSKVRRQAEKNRPDKKLEELEEELHRVAKKPRKHIQKAEYV